MRDSVRRSWTNWVLIGAAGLAVLAVVLTQTLWTSAERKARARHLVVGFRTDDVGRLEVRHTDKRVVIVREAQVQNANHAGQDEHAHVDARFRVVEPFQGEAEEVAVDGLLRAIEFATVVRSVDQATFDRRLAGLDEPEYVIELDMGEAELRVRVGNEAPAPKGARYVEVAGQRVANRGVYVVSESTARDLMVTPDAFRIKQLVPYAGSALEKIVLRSSERELTLMFDHERDGWRMARDGARVRVSTLAWERLFAAFARSELERVIGPEAENDDKSGAVKVQLTPRDASKGSVELVFGGKCPGAPELERATRLAPEKVAGCTRPLHLQTFVARPETLIDDRLLALRADEIEELTVTRGDKVLELARRESAWHMRRPQEGSVEREVGQSFIESLVALRGELRPPPEHPTTDVVVVARSAADTQKSVKEQRFELMHPTASGLFVHRLDDDVWLEVAPTVAQQLTPFDLLRRQAALTAFATSELDHVTLSTAQWQQRFAVTVEGKGCKLEAPAGYEAEPAACLDVIDALRSLRAQSWVGEARDARFGFEQPVAKVEWALKDGTKNVLTVGGVAKGQVHYAALDDGPVFTLANKTLQALTTLVVSRAPFVINPEALQSVVLDARGRHVELTRLGDEFVATGRGLEHEPTMDQTQTQALVDALGLLKAEAAVELIPEVGRREQGTLKRSAELGLSNALLEVRATQNSPSGEPQTTHFKIGVGDVYRDVSVFYAEPVSDGPHAVYVVPRASVVRVLDALE